MNAAAPVQPYARRESVLEEHVGFIRDLLEAGHTFRSIRAHLDRVHGVTLNVSWIHRFCTAQGLIKPKPRPKPEAAATVSEHDLLRSWLALQEDFSFLSLPPLLKERLDQLAASTTQLLDS